MHVGGPPPPRVPVPNMEPDELLEHFKPQIMQTLGIEGDEEAWQEITEGQAELAMAVRNRDDQVKSRDIWVRACWSPTGVECFSTRSHRFSEPALLMAV